jgi:ATP-dependent RNA helicase RhlE
VARPNATASTVEQRFYSTTDDDKRAVVRQLLKSRDLAQAIVFVNSKLGAARLARSFERDERLKSLAAFKAGEVDLLVATDVAARGLDITDLPAVFNFDVPFHAEDYVHRIGRTGRAGASGLAVTLVTRDDSRMVSDIERLIKKKIEIEPIELEDDRPRRPRRRDDEGETRDERPAYREDRDERPVRRAPEPLRSRAPADPFFDKPYEPGSSDATPAWESARSAAPVPARGILSPNIRPKKKVASLLGGAVDKTTA